MDTQAFHPDLQEAKWLQEDLEVMLDTLVGERERRLQHASLIPAVTNEKRTWLPGQPLEDLLGIPASKPHMVPRTHHYFQDRPLGMIAVLELTPTYGPSWTEAWASERTWEALGVNVNWIGWFMGDMNA